MVQSLKIEKLAGEYSECNEIVKRIIDLSLTQRQIIKIIELLALNIENIDHARQITDAVDFVRDINDKLTR